MEDSEKGGSLNESQALAALLKGSYISKEDLASAKAQAAKKKISTVTYLLKKELVTKDILGQALAESFDVLYADLNTNVPPRSQVLRVPEEEARKYRVVLYKEEKDGLILTTDSPEVEGLAEAMQRIFPNAPKASLAYSLPEDIDEVLRMYGSSLETRFGAIVKKGTRVAPEIVNEVISDAIDLRASDIHFEPGEKDVLVRFRVDDVLHEAGRLPKDVYSSVVNRIKVLAQLRTDEHAAAQDGAIRYNSKDADIDLRVSIAPVVDGEKIAIRLLARYVQSFDLKNIGLSQSDQEIIKSTSQLPFGMILVTGPTGSGKTTTLYAIMKTLNRPEVNITTIEDPVEYKLEGVNHIQVNKETDLTFAKGLRTIVRQDPNIILVGEIRDEETAEIAVNAALTGHLLLSTFHSNDAATAIPRLIDMKIEPFLLASTLEAVVSQRLVRTICDSCKVSVSLKDALVNIATPTHIQRHLKGVTSLYQGKGCNSCSNNGYKGRMAIFEIIKVTPEMENLILQSPSKQEVWQLAQKQGTKSMFEDGIEKVKSGQTTIEELLRVAEHQQEVAANVA